MVDFNAALIKKIVRLLESNHDGERAAAAGKLHSMAKDKGKNIDEMLAAVYGGGAQRPDSRNDARPKPGRSSWGNEWGGTNFKDPPGANSFAEEVRRAHEAEMKRQAEGVRRRYEAAEKAEREAEGKRYGDARDELQKHIDLCGTRMLTSWEKEFVDNIFDCKGALTGPQEATITRIIERYVNFGKRNGEADAFWKA
jgi:hypothetical protein